ncbi:MAG: type III deoxyribonuclease, partial [Elusimicrobia bacterium]|nr:type III deoxyribonuclease [Elusimicrobiota bacterium]
IDCVVRVISLCLAKMLREIFYEKILKIPKDIIQEKQVTEVDLSSKDWYAQTGLYGTSEEKDFIKFIDAFIERLQRKYSDIALLRNERFFQIFDFDDGRAFEPDFILLLKKRNHKISIYQIFIEPKGNQFKDNKGGFENSKEGWKQKFLLEIEKNAITNLKLENKRFKLLGLPFYNEKLKKDFKEALEKELL